MGRLVWIMARVCGSVSAWRTYSPAAQPLEISQKLRPCRSWKNPSDALHGRHERSVVAVAAAASYVPAGHGARAGMQAGWFAAGWNVSGGVHGEHSRSDVGVGRRASYVPAMHVRTGTHCSLFVLLDHVPPEHATQARFCVGDGGSATRVPAGQVRCCLQAAAFPCRAAAL